MNDTQNTTHAMKKKDIEYKEKDIEYIVEALKKSSPRYVRFIRLMIVHFDEKWLTEKDNKGDINNEHAK